MAKKFIFNLVNKNGSKVSTEKEVEAIADDLEKQARDSGEEEHDLSEYGL